MKKIFVLFILCFSLLHYNFIFADEFLNIDEIVDVPKTCEVLDTDGISHTYGEIDGPYLGICALDVLLESNYVTSVGLSNQYPEMGLFVTSFNEILADSSSRYWALYQNGSYASSGISTLEINQGDIISFKLSDFTGVETEDSVIIRINSLLDDDSEGDEGGGNSGGNSGGNVGGGVISGESFSISNAISFLEQNQNSDGSFINDMYTDWAAIAISLTNENSLLKLKIKNYLANQEFVSSLLTDNERHAMALMAMGIDPYSGTDVNYIEKIVDSFDGEQLGDEDLVNDDIFGLLVLSKAGYGENDEIISKILEFIIDQQENDGSFGSVDMTSAFIQIVYGFNNTFGLNEAIERAEDYLIENQDESGNFGNSFSTSWALQALSINDSFETEIEKAKNYLKDKQKEGGGVGELSDSLNSRIWATSYAIPAVLQQPWTVILESFEKEEINSLNIDENKKSEKELIIELIEAPVVKETKKEDDKIIINDVISRKQLVSNKNKNIITNNEVENIDTNTLLASAAGSIVESDYNQNSFTKMIYNLFVKLFSYLKIFWFNLAFII